MIKQSEMGELRLAVEALQRQNRRLTCGFYGLLIAVAIFAVTVALVPKSSASAPAVAPDSVLRVRGLIVVDADGKERVRIGAPLPDPLMQGRRYKRNGTISGILLLDADGTERSGYFTSDEPGTVALTLDTVQGQTAMFLANDEKGANLQIHDLDSHHSVGLYAVGSAPNLIVEREGRTIFELPTPVPEKSK